MAGHASRKRKRATDSFNDAEQVGSREMGAEEGRKVVRDLRERLDKLYDQCQGMTEPYKLKISRKTTTSFPSSTPRGRTTTTNTPNIAPLVSRKFTKKFWTLLDDQLMDLDRRLHSRLWNAPIKQLVVEEQDKLDSLSSEINTLEKEWESAMTMTAIAAAKILVVSSQMGQ